jgi:tetratricopeptide (TPR) repeat protein
MLVKEQPNVLLYWQELGHSLGNYGNLLTDTGRYQQAEAIVRRELEVRQKAVDDFPADPESIACLANAYMDLAKLRGSTGKWQEAVKAIRQELTLRKKHASEIPWPDIHLARTNMQLGDALLKTGAQDEAIAAYEEAIAVYKEIRRPKTDQATALVCWGQCLARAGSPNETVDAWLQAALDTDNEEVPNRIAWFLTTTPELPMQNPEKVIQLAKKAVNLAPQNGSSWTTLGAAYYRAEQWQDALAALDKAMQLPSGGDSGNWFFLALAQWQRGDAEKARHGYDQAVQWMDKNKPRDDDLHRLRAEAATQLGIREEALHK